MCQGQLVSKATYNKLWDLIGYIYRDSKPVSSGNFYLPDLRQMYIKGAGENKTYAFNIPVPSASLGTTIEESHPMYIKDVVQMVTAPTVFELSGQENAPQQTTNLLWLGCVAFEHKGL